MPRKAKQAQNTEEAHSEELEVIQEEKPKRPKRKCTEKQLAALAAGSNLRTKLLLMKSRRRMMPPINLRNKPIVNYTSFIISYI